MEKKKIINLLRDLSKIAKLCKNIETNNNHYDIHLLYIYEIIIDIMSSFIYKNNNMNINLLFDKIFWILDNIDNEIIEIIYFKERLNNVYENYINYFQASSLREPCLI